MKVRYNIHRMVRNKDKTMAAAEIIRNVNDLGKLFTSIFFADFDKEQNIRQIAVLTNKFINLIIY